MASYERERNDGREYFAVLYRLDGKQRSTSFEDLSRRLSSPMWPPSSASTNALIRR